MGDLAGGDGKHVFAVNGELFRMELIARYFDGVECAFEESGRWWFGAVGLAKPTDGSLRTWI